MMTIDDYMDAAKKRADIPSDRQLAFRLGATAATSCQWRTKRAWPGESIMRRLANLGGIDEELALLDLESWRTKDPETAKVFQRIRERLVKLKDAAAALIAISTAALFAATSPHPAHASTVHEQMYQSSATVIHYATFCPA